MRKVFLVASLLAAVMVTGPDASAQKHTGGASASPEPSTPKAKAKPKAKESQTDAGPRVPRVLREIAQCESGGDPTAVSSDGTYRGKYQFSRPTWRSVGGSGDPAAAPEAEQDRRAIKLYKAEGTAPWPNCA